MLHRLSGKYPSYIPFLSFFELRFFLVNAKRVINKIPVLLADGCTTETKYRNDFMRNRYRLMMLKKRRPERFNTLAFQLLAILEEMDAEIGAPK